MKKRDSFNNKWGFILACIGSAVGMGNIWMFPTRVSMYGGGSYLIPYFIFVALIGFTGVIGEMSFGRATKSGPVDAFGYACETKNKRKLGEVIGFIPVLGAQSSPNLCVNLSSSYVSPSMLPLSSGDLIEWSLVCHSTLSYQKFCDRHSNHYDHPEELHQSIE